jgi:hypothetical protein
MLGIVVAENCAGSGSDLVEQVDANNNPAETQKSRVELTIQFSYRNCFVIWRDQTCLNKDFVFVYVFAAIDIQ